MKFFYLYIYQTLTQRATFYRNESKLIQVFCNNLPLLKCHLFHNLFSYRKQHGYNRLTFNCVSNTTSLEDVGTKS